VRAWAAILPVMLGCAGLAPAPPSAPVPAAALREAGAACHLAGALAIRLSPPAIDRAAARPSRRNLRAWVNLLADPALLGRDSGSDEERAVAVLLAGALSDLGIEGAFGGGEYCQPFTWHWGSDQNVVGVLRRPGGGGGPAVILGAHYDGQGHCAGEVCPGADDNASGVAALLEAARLLAARRSALRGDVVIAFFGAEEQHIMGSSHFVRHPPVPFARVERMINLDMVGRQLLEGQPYRFLVCNEADAFGYVVGGPGREATEEALERAAGRVGTSVYGIGEGLLVGAGFYSDSVPFSPHVPTLFLSTSIHDDYHRPGDVPEKVDLGQVERAVRLVTALVLDP
jgi:Peptidase family M28